MILRHEAADRGVAQVEADLPADGGEDAGPGPGDPAAPQLPQLGPVAGTHHRAAEPRLTPYLTHSRDFQAF